ncbi:MAG: (Fe-S)-binding protein, partial [Alphaproteobacteria bacterium]
VARGEGRFPATVTYHDACAGLRELEVERQPRALLAGIEGLELRELGAAEECCGFGGTFCVKYSDISLDITDRKIDEVVATGADVLLAGDLGCLMNMAGRLKRRGDVIEVRHVAEVLAGLTAEVAPIAGEGDA